MTYTPPDGDLANFGLDSYTVPEGDAVNFELSPGVFVKIKIGGVFVDKPMLIKVGNIDSFETDFDGWYSTPLNNGTIQRSTGWSSHGVYSVYYKNNTGIGSIGLYFKKEIDLTNINEIKFDLNVVTLYSDIGSLIPLSVYLSSVSGGVNNEVYTTSVTGVRTVTLDVSAISGTRWINIGPYGEYYIDKILIGAKGFVQVQNNILIKK